MRIAAHGDEGASHAVDLLCRGGDVGAEVAWVVVETGHRGELISCARTWRISITRSLAIPNISTRKLGTAGCACRSAHLLARRIVIPLSRRLYRRHRAAAAAHVAIMEPAGSEADSSIRSRTRLKNNLSCGSGRDHDMSPRNIYRSWSVSARLCWACRRRCRHRRKRFCRALTV